MIDKSFLQSLSVVFAALAFAGVCWWTFSPSRRKKFDEAANLPFADEPAHTHSDQNLEDPQRAAEAEANNKVEKL